MKNSEILQKKIHHDFNLLEIPFGTKVFPFYK